MYWVVELSKRRFWGWSSLEEAPPGGLATFALGMPAAGLAAALWLAGGKRNCTRGGRAAPPPSVASLPVGAGEDGRSFSSAALNENRGGGMGGVGL